LPKESGGNVYNESVRASRATDAGVTAVGVRAMKRAREEDDESTRAAVPEETGSPVARPSITSEDEPGAIADRDPGVPTASLDPALAVYEGARASVTLKPEFAKNLRVADVHELVTWVLTSGGREPAVGVRAAQARGAPGGDDPRARAGRETVRGGGGAHAQHPQKAW
jgi:hypothetical protein